MDPTTILFFQNPGLKYIFKTEFLALKGTAVIKTDFGEEIRQDVVRRDARLVQPVPRAL